MLIGMLMAVLIVGLLVIGPSFENIWVTLAVYGGIIGGMLLAWWYSGRLSGGIAGFMLGDSAGADAQETYSLAERYETEHEYGKAIEQYRRAIEKDKKNVQPRMKLADLHYRLGEYDRCITHMQEAVDLSRTMPMSERCALMNRLADVYLEQKHDPVSALEILRKIVTEFPDSRYAVYARDRMMQIKERR